MSSIRRVNVKNLTAGKLSLMKLMSLLGRIVLLLELFGPKLTDCGISR